MPGPVIGRLIVEDQVPQNPVDDAPPTNPAEYQPPPFINSALPNPSALNAAHKKDASNTISLNAAFTGEPEWWVIGRTMAEGRVIAAHDATGELVIDVQWSYGEVEEYEHRVFAGIREGLGTALGENEHFVGTAGQSASTIMTNLLGSYDALPNRAHSVLTLNPAFQPKTLDIRMLMKGMKFFDPRPSPQVTEYTTTPALITAGMLQASGYTFNTEGWDSVGTVADYNEELVGSPGIVRWEISGQIQTRQDLATWLEAMQAYGHFFIDIQGDVVYLQPDAPRASSHTVSGDSAFVAGTERKVRPGGRNVPAAVICHFEELVESGDNVSLVPSSYTNGTPGGAGTITHLRMPFVPDVARAGRHAEEAYLKAQSDLEFSFDSFDAGLARLVGDRGSITNPPFALASEDMYLLKHHQVSPGRWRHEYHSYSAGNYSDALHTGTTNYNPLQNADEPPTGPTPTLTEELAVDAGGLTYARIKINFNGVVWAYIKEYRVTVTGDNGTTILISDPVTHQGANIVHELYTSDPLTSGVEYTVSVYVRSVSDALGDPGTATLTPSNATNALLDVGNPTNMHVYILDGDGKYATTSEKTGSPAVGETFASRFGADSPMGQPWGASETWLGDQLCLTVFETEVWDSGQAWDGEWRMSALNISTLNGATRAPNVSLSGDVSPHSFTDHSGLAYSGAARFAKAECQVGDSPIQAGHGLHVKLPIPFAFTLGA